MYFTETAEGTVLNVKAQPRSSKAGVEGLLGDAVKVRIRCAPVDGKANKELIETLADVFGLPKSRVVFKSGETSKQKRILLMGVTADEVRRVVDARRRRSTGSSCGWRSARRRRRRRMAKCQRAA